MCDHYDITCQGCERRGVRFEIHDRPVIAEEDAMIRWEVGEYVCDACGWRERHARPVEGMIMGEVFLGTTGADEMERATP